MTVKNASFSAMSETSGLSPYQFETRQPKGKECLVKVQYCGICHSDIHMSKNDWGVSSYPLTPGHEFVGVIDTCGDGVTKCKVGDHVGIGCFIASCGECEMCKKGDEQYCQKGMIQTYGSVYEGERTHGGYARYVVCLEDYMVKLPSNLDLTRAAPLFCAGITTYTPYIDHNIKNKKVAVLGFGGLGEMAVKWGSALNNEVSIFSTSASKEKLASELGAKFILSTDAEQMKDCQNKFDFILDTIPCGKDLSLYLSTLKAQGTYVILGAPHHSINYQISPMQIITRGLRIAGSCIGGIKGLTECINFAAEHQIYPSVEEVECKDVNKAFERVMANDVRFRFVMNVEKTGLDPETGAIQSAA